MRVGRTLKETTDRSRVVVDFLDWLDPGEGVSGYTTPEVALDTGAWSGMALPLEPPEDITPLVVFDDAPADANTKVVFLLDAGTPGLAYQVRIVATGGVSGRMQTVEFAVDVQETS